MGSLKEAVSCVLECQRDDRKIFFRDMQKSGLIKKSSAGTTIVVVAVSDEFMLERPLPGFRAGGVVGRF